MAKRGSRARADRAGAEEIERLSDHYAEGTYRWWHLSRPSPELLQALADW